MREIVLNQINQQQYIKPSNFKILQFQSTVSSCHLETGPTDLSSVKSFNCTSDQNPLQAWHPNDNQGLNEAVSIISDSKHNTGIPGPAVYLAVGCLRFFVFGGGLSRK